MGGFECSTHRIRSGRRLDIVASSQHERFAFQDYQRLRETEMTTARDGFRWHLIETSPGYYDFSSALPVIRAARENGVQVVWDLMHYGWPDGLDILSPEFVIRFADFARAAAGVLQTKNPAAPIICPINEISFFRGPPGKSSIFIRFSMARRRSERANDSRLRRSDGRDLASRARSSLCALRPDDSCGGQR